MILNRQRDLRVERPALEAFFRRLRRELNLGAAEVTICLVSDAEIARMNESFRKKKGPTDVLSFPAVPHRKRVRLPHRLTGLGTDLAVRKRANKQRALTSTSEDQFLGDIAIAPSTARRNARKFGRTLPIEIQILILHGMLHLLGFDHETDNGQMDRVEQRLRRRLGLA